MCSVDFVCVRVFTSKFPVWYDAETLLKEIQLKLIYTFASIPVHIKWIANFVSIVFRKQQNYTQFDVEIFDHHLNSYIVC